MRAGLEVHQQLAVGKLFCGCPSELTEEVRGSIVRGLRPTGGENHTVDPAVAFEAARGLRFRYETTASDCLVEVDEEPPHALNRAALEVALVVARLLNAHPVDEIEVMRKIVIDGSNTSGFQRTALIAVDGWVEVDGRRYSIATVCLEEDAARKVGEGAGETRYRLDRLGIPLIEIATGPEVTDGREARRVAEEIGALLRATRSVRRGIGSIREDLNVSTPGGTRIEIKGVQELRLVERYVRQEAQRQETLLAVGEELRRRAAGPVPEGEVDLTALIDGVGSGPLRQVGREGSVAFGLRLPGFHGLLGGARDDERLGRELADYARSAGVKGLIHSDELPAYGLDAARVDRIRSALGASATDGFALVSAPGERLARAALGRVRERARWASEGIPPETRDPLPDGRSRYSRPLPGRDRMYPETDVAPIPIDPARHPGLTSPLPELPSATQARVAARYGLNAEVARSLVDDDALDRFEALVARGHPAPITARLLTQDRAEAAPEGDRPSRDLTLSELDELLRLVAEHRVAKEALVPILRRLNSGPVSVAEAVGATGLAPVSREELERLAEELLVENASLVRERRERALSPLMGDLMRRVRGRHDGEEVARVLRAALERHLAVVGSA